ncbi:hypothetical protein CAP35_10410 [Chitinophagaceae bacterium IBVUCB1]|nr:hypothetical protein CAP35_10410 [Chitinophagaceae bacterium IBVUCB1]
MDMKKIALVVLSLLAVSVSADAQSNRGKNKKMVIKAKPVVRRDTVVAPVPAKWDSTMCFPLSADKDYHLYDYVIYLDDIRVIKRYKPFFDKHKYTFSGYVWEALLRDMLADADKEISTNTVIRSESNAVMINITKYQSIKKFPEYMCPILSNLTKVNEYLQKANRDKMPKY